MLKIESEIEKIPKSVGVHQGDNMAPVLFLFLMTAFAQTLELEWKKLDIPILSVMTAGDEHLAGGKICSHTPKMVKSKKLTTYEILQCLYVDDGAFPFGTREDMQRGMELIYHHFARFGLEMHIGRGTSESKTECIFFPPPQFFQQLERTNTAATTIQCAFCRNTLHRKNPPKMPLTTTKRGHRDNENKTTLHMTTLPRQQKSLSPTDLSASHAHFATWVLSSIIVSVTTTTSRQESCQPLLRWVH
jgi:hypothetical protein